MGCKLFLTSTWTTFGPKPVWVVHEEGPDNITIVRNKTPWSISDGTNLVKVSLLLVFL